MPDLPRIVPNKRNRIYTKHFTQLMMWEDRDMVAMLNWLVYVSRIDGSVLYSTQLLRKYGMTVIEANRHYFPERSSKEPNGLKTNKTAARITFLKLIERGLLWPTSVKNRYLISPMLCYHCKAFSVSEYELICKRYQNISPYGLKVLADDVIHIVNSKYQ